MDTSTENSATLQAVHLALQSKKERAHVDTITPEEWVVVINAQLDMIRPWSKYLAGARQLDQKIQPPCTNLEKRVWTKKAVGEFCKEPFSRKQRVFDLFDHTYEVLSSSFYSEELLLDYKTTNLIFFCCDGSVKLKESIKTTPRGDDYVLIPRLEFVEKIKIFSLKDEKDLLRILKKMKYNASMVKFCFRITLSLYQLLQETIRLNENRMNHFRSMESRLESLNKIYAPEFTFL